ncbi:cold-regulated protein 27-like [Amaranthus tricolor]|uniref:cold-regulated protein 27-like n=1 Tax=Amaranthus tricolor TaxID=29722 RepID=UPI0025895F1D|nr:cold-regulated protein 27-like [Amaranthus tricolor]
MADTSVSSQSYEVTGPDLSSFLQQDHEICSLEFLEKEYMSTEWTDEKHSLFLKSIETSFVHQLYRSINSSGLHSQSQSKLSSHMRSSKHKTSRAADQRMKLERGEPPPPKPGKSCIMLQNPWNHHFKSKDDLPIPASSSFGSEPMSFVHTLSNTSDNFRLCQTTRDSSIEEHSGQNFDEEDDDETLCCMHTTKRMKIVEAASKNQE